MHGLTLPVVMIDGLHVADHVVLLALGFDDEGRKHPLGVWLTATENAQACTAFLNDLVGRGLDPGRSTLFVIDGGKGLRRAIRDVFGARALVQRCQVHKRRNVVAHLPKKLHPSVGKALRDAYRAKSPKTAKRSLLALARRLEDDHPSAAASLREGLDEVLTVKTFGLPAALERSFSSTNAIENLNGGVRHIARRVKRWRSGSMVRRGGRRLHARAAEDLPTCPRLQGHAQAHQWPATTR